MPSIHCSVFLEFNFHHCETSVFPLFFRKQTGFLIVAVKWGNLYMLCHLSYFLLSFVDGLVFPSTSSLNLCKQQRLYIQTPSTSLSPLFQTPLPWVNCVGSRYTVLVGRGVSKECPSRSCILGTHQSTSNLRHTVSFPISFILSLVQSVIHTITLHLFVLKYWS